MDISDLTRLIDYLYISFRPPFPSVLLGDCDCDGLVDGSDVNWLIDYFFYDGPPPDYPCFEFGD